MGPGEPAQLCYCVSGPVDSTGTPRHGQVSPVSLTAAHLCLLITTRFTGPPRRVTTTDRQAQATPHGSMKDPMSKNSLHGHTHREQTREASGSQSVDQNHHSALTDAQYRGLRSRTCWPLTWMGTLLWPVSGPGQSKWDKGHEHWHR